ncbi:DUF4012 domain-containing protein [Patescibacteria group bacterium]
MSQEPAKKESISLPKPKPKTLIEKSEDIPKITPGKETKMLEKSKSSIKQSSKKPKKKITKKKKIVLAIIVIILIPIFASIYPIYQLLNLGKNTQNTVNELTEAAKSQNLVLASEKLNKFHQDLKGIERTYKLLSWMEYSPFRWHYQDGKRVILAAISGTEAGKAGLDAVMPYTDVLGLEGEGTFTGGTTEDRIVAILDTLDKISPVLDEVSSKLKFANEQISQIDPKRYPEKIAGRSVEDVIQEGKSYLNSAASGIDNVKPVIEVLPKLAGVDETKRYLVLFQNDAELRPTGGFMTAYAIMDLTRGTIIAERSEDIYSLDNKFNKRLQPPKPIEKYFPLVYYWYLRDMNLSPDFKVSMDTFVQYYEQVPGEPEVDGIISIDTNVLKDLVAVLGPVDVPGYGSFSSEIVPQCECPQVIWKLEDMVTRPVSEIRTDRKAVLGPMMQTLLQKAYDADSNAWPELFQSMFKNVAEKHILFYMKDEQIQNAAEKINVAGRMVDYDGDYLHINDANFGGAKSNMFVTQEVDQEIEINEGSVTKDVTLVYKNPFRGSNCNLEAGKLCLNGILRDFIRIYIPIGSELVETQGFEKDSVEVYEELGKTVIEGFFLLQPQSQTKLKLTYSSPYSPTDKYKLMIQKQPGTYAPKHTITIGDSFEEFELLSDKTLEIDL